MTHSLVWHPFTQHGLDDDIPLIARAEGAWLYGADGRQWLDCISSWWVTTHGHGHPKIMAAIRAQTVKLDQLIFAGWTHEPAETLARALVSLVPDPLNYAFFSDSGSTSVEVALKMALGFWRNRGETRHKIVVMEHSYHGDTIGAMSVGARGVYNAAYAPLLFDVVRVPFPERAGQNTLDALEAACRDPHTAAFIVEPLILGAGGMLIYPASILAEMRAICVRHHVLFIADEVMTGWGRTGTLFACEQAGVTPDLMCLSKGLTGGAIPLAVTLASDAIYDAHRTPHRADMFYHSSSYTANPIACAAANANLTIWRDEPVLARVATLAEQQETYLAALTHPALINQRQCGTITAMEIASDTPGYLDDIGPRLASEFRNRGLLLRPMGNTLYVMPP
ncbi:MAG: adenosylmethionine--8-amino-7-oxononanoate transaminase, partial [Alphaproteobacteria bacterium]|nr:adenosylmethionine--8-amino-7-oxononanoate transaminase [Alphaproteobacteria bacterium]